MTWLPARAGGADPFERVFRLRPNLYEAWREFAEVFYEKQLVDPTLLELARLRVAQLHRAAWPLSQRRPEAPLDPQRVAALERWWEGDAFDARERACLRFAEQFVLDASGIGDADAAAVRMALGDAGMVAFVEALALFDGFTRFCVILGIAQDAGPEARA